MPYLSLPNFNYDSGPRRIQSGPDHEGYVVLYSGVQSTGPDEGIVVAGAPLSGTLALGAWDYDANWRYVPSTLPSQSGVLNPTPYNVSGALDTYDATRISTRNTVAGAQIASAIGPETGAVTPRGGALQPGSNVTQPEKYMYYGGAAPDNQNYSPYNTPDANSAAEGKTGGGVTHKTFESSLLTNVLGGQGTSDRSQWRYHQPVYCKTYTETKRSDVPGLMSTPLRAVYRGGSTSYNYNYGGELLANRGGFELLPPDDEVLGCPFPVGCPIAVGSPLFLSPGNVLVASPPCTYVSIEWYRSNSSESIGVGTNYTITNSDIDSKLYYVVTYPDGSTDQSSETCFETVLAPISKNWYRLYYDGQSLLTESGLAVSSSVVFDNNGDTWSVKLYAQSDSAAVHRVTANAEIIWSFEYRPDTSQNNFTDITGPSNIFLIDGDNDTLEIFYQRWTKSVSPSISNPTRIYRFTVNKSTGNVVETRTITYTNASTLVANDTMINVIKKDDYYYILQDKYVPGDSFTTCVHKFDLSLNLIWVKQLKGATKTFGVDVCAVEGNAAPQDLKESNGKLVGCGGIGGLNRANPSAFIIDLAGNLVRTLPYVRGLPAVFTFPYVYVPRSVEIDDNESVYTVGGFESPPELLGQTYGRVLILKQDNIGNLIWAIDCAPTISSVAPNGRANVFHGRHLLIINNKLVFVGLIEVSLTVPSTFNVFVSVLNLENGFIERAFRITSGTTTANNRQGQRMKISKMKQPGGFIVTTSVGFRFTFDIDNLPNAGTYLASSSIYRYVITNATVVQTSRLSELESVSTGSCSVFPLVVPPISSGYGVNTTISGVAWPPSGTPTVSGISLVQN